MERSKNYQINLQINLDLQHPSTSLGTSGLKNHLDYQKIVHSIVNLRLAGRSEANQPAINFNF